ncbi:transglycosylase SLT domain-containing protein [Thalassospira sp. CH_XMU1420-2]|uniref:transglycosylase SLT domain-containing protein n=1 Tax=Thalassospira sp. CH_XMU1420-2 TaxID=3107769 RepID=UPI00300B9AF3
MAGANALELPMDFERAAENEGVDPLLLFAVALKESKNGVGEGIAPSPFAIRDATGSYYFDSLIEAETFLENSIASGQSNIDVGMMQINYGQHKGYVTDPKTMLDPYLNVRIGARILRTAMNSVPNDTVLGIGRYHHWRDENRARKYGSSVISIWKNLQTLVAKNAGK